MAGDEEKKDEKIEKEQEKKSPEKKGWSTGKKVGVIVAVICVVVIVAAISWVWFFPDRDGDGILDRDDAFPDDPNEWKDSDRDGVGDNSDALPFNPTQISDKDGDGYGDNPFGTQADAFPNNPNEWVDSDGDWIGDNADFYDEGDGKVYCKITYYKDDGFTDGERGLAGAPDPYFLICWDIDGDGKYERVDNSSQSKNYAERREIIEPFSATYNVPDDTKTVEITLFVYDSDFWDEDDIIDIHPSPDANGLRFIYDTSAGVWAGGDNGMKDLVQNEFNAEIAWEIGITG